MILDRLAASARKRVEEKKRRRPLTELQREAEAMEKNTGFPFRQALEAEGISFICEVKKASPSKGIIAEQFPYLEIAEDYQAAGAAAISVLTEPEYFLGQDRYLKEIARQYQVSYPTVRLRLDRLIQKIKLADQEGEEPFAAFIKGLAVDSRIDVDVAKLILDKYEKERKHI